MFSARPSGVRPDNRAENGTGLIGSLVGVTVFLTLLLFAVHLVLNLYATTVVTAVAFDAARVVAGSDGGREAEVAAKRQARAVLGRYEDEGDLDFGWRYVSTDGDGVPDVVELRVVAVHPTALLAHRRVPFQRVDRTVRVRLERFR